MKATRAITAGFLAALLLVLLGAVAAHEPPAKPAKRAMSFEERMGAERRDYLGDVDQHHDCWSLVGASPYVLCRDGYSISS
ncbi:hypothetical protein ACWDCL_01735 [Streptomyces sp. NPDC001009]